MSSSDYLYRNHRVVGDRIMTEGDYQSGAAAVAGVGLIVLLSGFLNNAFPVHRMIRQIMGLISASISFCACAIAFADTAKTLEPQWVILCYALFVLLALLVWLITFYLAAFILCLAIAYPAYQIDWSVGMMVLIFLMAARPMIASYKEKRWTGFTALACVVGLSVACFCAAIGTKIPPHEVIAQAAPTIPAISNPEVRAVSPPPVAAAPAPLPVASVAIPQESAVVAAPIAARSAQPLEPRREMAPPESPVQAAAIPDSSMFKLGAVAQILQLAHAKDWVGVDSMAATYRSQASNYPPGDPKAAGIQNTEGVAALRRNDLSSAIAAFQRAAQANPSDPVALNNLGAAFFRARRTDEAVNIFTELLHRSPDRATAWANLSEAIVADPDAATSALSLAFHFNQNRGKLQQEFTSLANTAPDQQLRTVITSVLASADAIPVSR